MKRYILTGTPGSGKTSIIQELAKQGYDVIHEAATDVIAHEQVLGVLEPWRLSDFIDKIVVVQKQRQEEASHRDVALQFYDRSPLCTYALSVYLSFKPSPILLQEIKRLQDHALFKKKVLFVENLGFITLTEARKISFEEALRFEHIHSDVYGHFGYECIKVPNAPLQDRVDHLLRSI